MIPFLALEGFFLLYTFRSGRHFSEAPLVLVPLVALILLAGGFVGALQGTAVALLIAGHSSLVAFLACGRKQPARALEILTSPTHAIYLVTMVFLARRFLTGEGAQFMFPDEFALWALQAKHLFVTNSLPAQGFVSSPSFTWYPPGAALLHYFVTKGAEYREGYVYLAHSLLFFAPVLAVLRETSWRRAPVTIAIFLCAALGSFLILAVPFPTWSIPLRTIYVDGLLASFFGGTAGYYFLARREDPHALLKVIPALGYSPLIKPYGALFSALALFCAAGMVVADLAAFRLRRKWRATPQRKRMYKKLARELLAVIFCLLVPAVVHLSWQKFSPFAEDLKKRTTNFSSKQIAAAFEGTERPVTNERIHTYTKGFRENTVNRWGRGFLSRDKKNQLSYNATAPVIAGALAFLWLAILLTLPWTRRNRLQGISVLITLAAGFGVYVLFLLAVFIYVRYAWGERVSMHSMDRYWSSFLFGGFLILLAMLSKASQSAWKRGRIASYALTALLLLTIASQSIFAWSIFGRPIDEWTDRRPIREISEVLKKQIKPSDKVYVVYKDTMYYRYLIYQYEMLPVSVWDWVFGIPVHETRQPIHSPTHEGKGNWNVAPEQWAETLTAFQWVVLGQVDQEFWDRYASLFDRPEQARLQRVFRVNRGADGRIKLVGAG